MAQRRTPIQVPPRQDDEAPATAEQLQFIRQLVTGMSLQGFRFDYRKMGTGQAASIIDQLQQLRDASGMATPNKSSGVGCVGAVMRAFARGVTALIIAAIVLAGVAGGGYLIWQKINEKPNAGGSAQSDASNDGGAADGGANDPSHKESEIFDGLYVEDGTPPGESDRAEPHNPADRKPTTDAPGPGTPDITPTPDPAVAEQLDDLRLMLAQLKQFTRQDYDASVRGISAERMLERFNQQSALLDALDPVLAERVKRVLAGYAVAELDGQAMRAEIDALLEALEAWDGS